MKRITVKQVKAAYERTGFKPIRGDTKRRCTNECCPAYAVGNLTGDISEIEDKCIKNLEREGYTLFYLMAFAVGVDSDDNSPKRYVDVDGFNDGVAVRKALFGI